MICKFGTFNLFVSFHFFQGNHQDNEWDMAEQLLEELLGDVEGMNGLSGLSQKRNHHTATDRHVLTYQRWV